MKILFKSITVSLLILVIFSCKSKSEKEVSFLTFNVWQEGTSVPNGFEQIRDVVLETSPDVVCFVEVRNYNNEDWTTKIIDSLGASGEKYYAGYVGGDVSFISKYPLTNGVQLFTNSDKGTVVKFNLNLEKDTVVIAGAHLDYTYYASNLPRGYNGGTPNWQIIDNGNNAPLPFLNRDSIQSYSLKSSRDEAIATFISQTKSEAKPIVLMGDFNEPSFLDWTEKTKNMFDHNGVIINWWNTNFLAKNGFIDSFREFYPDEVKNPGITWPSTTSANKSTSWTPMSDERDRVDYIFYKGNNIVIKKVCLVGPTESYANNKLTNSNTSNESFLASNLPWPSDHKAVFTSLSFNF